MTDDPPQPGDDPVAQLVSALSASGFPRIPAAVLMTIMTSEQAALTAEELADRVGVSAAAISGAVRYLSTVRMIHRHRIPGSRRYVYELPADSWYTASIGKNTLYDVITRLAESAATDLGPRGAQQVREMADFFRFIQVRMPQLLDEWNDLRAKQAASDA